MGLGSYYFTIGTLVVMGILPVICWIITEIQWKIWKKKWDEDHKEKEYSNVIESFVKLREASGSHWDGIDPDKYVQELRED